MCIEQQIQAYRELIDQDRYSPDNCPNCQHADLRSAGLVPRHVYHEKDENIVDTVIPVGCWTCLRCRQTRRYLPPFIRPHKRYAVATIKKMVRRVVRLPHMTYRKAARRKDRRVQGYSRPKWGRLPNLAFSSIWHWVTALAEDRVRALRQNPRAATASGETSMKEVAPRVLRNRCNTEERFGALLLAASTDFSQTFHDFETR